MRFEAACPAYASLEFRSLVAGGEILPALGRVTGGPVEEWHQEGDSRAAE